MEIFFDSNIAIFLQRTESFLLENIALNSKILATCAVLKNQTQPARAINYVSCLEDDRCVGALLNIMPAHLNLAFNSSCEALTQIIKEFSLRGMPISGCFGAGASNFVKMWQLQRHEKFSLHRTLNAYRLGTISDEIVLQGQLRRATKEDFNLIKDWRRSFLIEVWAGSDNDEAIKNDTLRWIDRQECYLLEDNGKPCSLINAFDIGYNTVRLCSVYTPKHLRGHGYAESLVKQVAVPLLKQGKTCILDADKNNPISNHIYQKIGFNLVGELEDYILL